MSTTDRSRRALVVLFVLVMLATTAGWLFLERDPSQMAGVLMWAAMAVGIGEASNVGKRATFKKEAVE